MTEDRDPRENDCPDDHYGYKASLDSRISAVANRGNVLALEIANAITDLRFPDHKKPPNCASPATLPIGVLKANTEEFASRLEAYFGSC